MSDKSTPPPVHINREEVDLLVIGSGTGLATALAATERGLDVAIAEKTAYVGGSTARSGGAIWIPANPVLQESGAGDDLERAAEYLSGLVGDSARWRSFLEYGGEAVRMLMRMTDLRFFWVKGYADYHPETPGGSARGRSVESRPFDLASLGDARRLLRPGVMEAPFPMPVTGADYKWLNLVARTPLRALPRALGRLVQGLGGAALRREYAAGGQALAGGLFAGALRVGIPIWTQAPLVRLIREDERVTGAVLLQNGAEHIVRARRGVVLATGGFDHALELRRERQLASLTTDLSLGAEGNTGDGIRIGQEAGAAVAQMDQAWWFPAVAPLGDGKQPAVLLAERSLPGSFIVDASGERFVNESTGYMVFGQEVQRRERAGDPVGDMWLIFDQRYRDGYLFAGAIAPRAPLPESWYRAGIAHRAATPQGLAEAIGLPVRTFQNTLSRFNAGARSGIDSDFGRGNSAYDRYYGDPTQSPNPNLRALEGKAYYAVRLVLSDLGTCGGIQADDRGRVLTPDGEVVPGLFAQGNTAANVFGQVYPGAGATIGQGIVCGTIIAETAARPEAV